MKIAFEDLADPHLDPLTGEPGAHPIGAGIGAAVGGAAGVALGAGASMAAGSVLGAAAGPLGVVCGAVAGGLVGGVAGRAVAETIDPSAPIEAEDLGDGVGPEEEAYWHELFDLAEYVRPGCSFPDYLPAYQYGWECRLWHGFRPFVEVEPELRRGWERARRTSPLSWEDARPAVFDAWEHPRQEAEGSPTPGSEELV